MAVMGMHHCSFVVTDIERTVDFYERLVDLELVARAKNVSKGLGKALGVKQAEAELNIAFMKAGNTLIEFIEYVNPNVKPCPKDPSVAGTGHICFKVDDINSTKKKLEDAGIKFNSDPNISREVPGKMFKWCYFKDHDGITMELLEETDEAWQETASQ